MFLDISSGQAWDNTLHMGRGGEEGRRERETNDDLSLSQGKKVHMLQEFFSSFPRFHGSFAARK